MPITTTRAFAAAVGVNVHWQNAGGSPADPQTNAADILTDMATLGVSGMRGRAPFWPPDSYTVGKLNALLSGGVGTYCMLQNGTTINGVATAIPVPNQIAAIKGLLAANPGVSAIIEGGNEPQNYPITWGGASDTVANGYAATHGYQRNLGIGASSDLALAKVPVASPSWDPPPLIGQVAGIFPVPWKYPNQHVYPYCGGPAPGVAQPFVAGKAAPLLAPYFGLRSDWIATECGFSSSPVGGTMSVDAATQARLLLCLICQLVRQGCVAPFIYSLYDDAVTSTTWSDSCGLFTYGRAIKPAGQALANLMGYLAGASPISATGAVPWFEPTGAYLLPLQRDAHTWDVLIWNEPVIWDYVGRAPITPTPAAVTLNLPFTATSIQTYDPIAGTATAGSPPASIVNATLHGYPLVVRVSK